MHKAQAEWCHLWAMRERFPEHFKNVKVLDVGSLDISGTNRHLFTFSDYTGIDVVEGRNVDVICKAHEFDVPDCSFDTVISTNALEHDMYWAQTILAMYRFTRIGGLMFFSAAAGWDEHGTTENGPTKSGTAKMGEPWASYYKNLRASNILMVMPFTCDMFSQWGIEDNGRDTRFWGVKKQWPS
tara:strand:+ start:673 stop:1224 length:552 start_codon:yes stop_codon:yes gene_type:complete